MQIANVVKEVQPAIVRIDVTGPGFSAAGSGVILDSAGHVLTNQHVIANVTAITLTVMDGSAYSATIVKSDSNIDLAVLQISSSQNNFTPITLGSAADTYVGEDVLAVGFPLGPDLPGPATFTRGIVSAMRTMGGQDYVQTDVTINPGNSGGGLINFDGKLLGVPTAGIVPPRTDAENIGLAIPVEVAKTFIQSAIGNLP